VTRKTVEKLAKEMAHSQPPLKTHQLRRFFQHCRAVEGGLKSGSKWENERPRILFLDAAAAYAFNRSEPRIPRLFYDFVRLNVAQVHNERDFLCGFLPHFEALVGFSALYIG